MPRNSATLRVSPTHSSGRPSARTISLPPSSAHSLSQAEHHDARRDGPLLDSTAPAPTTQPRHGAAAPGATVTEPTRIRVLIVDDHSVVRMGLRMFFELQDDIEVVGEATDGSEGVAMARRLEPDVVLMDLLMPNMDGVTAIG